MAAHPGSVVGIEGPNKVNNWPVSYAGLTGTAGAQAYQQALFDAVNADPLLMDIAVLGFTDYPDHASASDWNNVHAYPKNGDQLTGDQPYAEPNFPDPSKPFAITEMGYHTSLTAYSAGGWEGVSETTQAKLLLNALMDAAALGSRSTSIYQLLDAYADPQGSDQEKHFGLFRLDGSAKPAASAIHNLTGILTDDGTKAAVFDAGHLSYSVAGLPSSGHTYLTESSGGSFQIIAWNEPDIWNEINHAPIAAINTSITISFEQTSDTVQVFDPLQGGSAIQVLHNVSSADLVLTDHPLIIQLSAPGLAATDQNAAAIARLYYAMLDRAPDAAGLQYWTGAVENGSKSLHDVAQAMINSTEYAGNHGGVTASAYVESVYEQVLGRHSDAAGLQSWTDALAHGTAQTSVAIAAMGSSEYQGQYAGQSSAAYVEGLYEHLFGRQGDAAGVQSWTSALDSHATTRVDLADAFVNSAEFQAHFGLQGGGASGGPSDAAFVESVYEQVLGRHSDAAGLQGWTDALAHGTAPTSVAIAAVGSSEYQGQYAGQSSAAYVEGLYEHLFGRQGDAAGVQSWTSALDSHATTRVDLANAFVNSAEFQVHFGVQNGGVSSTASGGPSDASFVEGLYENALGRHADAGGLQGWTDALAHGTSRADVAVAIAEGAEAQQHLAAQIQQSYHVA